MLNQPQHTNLLTILTQAPTRISSIPETIKSLFLFCLLLTISCCTNPSFAQFSYELDKTTRFEKIGAEEGLSSGYVCCIHQDKYGFIWIGTQYGLNLYDGYEFKIFTANPKNPQSLYNNWIKDILEEPDGTLWFATNLGISKYNRANQTFTTYFPDTNDINSDSNSPDKILLDGDQLWVDVWRNDLFRFNKHTGEFRSFAKDTINPSNGIYGNTDYMFIDGAGDL